MPVSLMQGGNLGATCQDMATPSLPAAVHSKGELPLGWENDLILSTENDSRIAPTMAPPRPQFNMSVVIMSTRGQ